MADEIPFTTAPATAGELIDGAKDAYFEVDGVVLHYVEVGEGPLIIFYHGFPLFWFSFHHQMSALKGHFRCVAVDGPGINLSSKPQSLEPFKLEQLAAQLDGLARYLVGDERFFLVGHDWGGALGWSYAQAYPHRLHRLVVINAPPTNQLLELLLNDEEQQKRSSYMYSMRDGETHRLITENGAQLMWKNAYAKFRELDHYTDLHDSVFQHGLAQPGAIDGGINWYRANIPFIDVIAEQHFWPHRHATTSTQSLLIWGEADDTFVSRFIEALPRYASNLSVCRLPEVGHTPMLEVPSRVTEILLDFLRIETAQ